MKFPHAFLLFFFFLLFVISTNAQRSLQWNKNDDSYFVVEGNAVVEYQLPSFHQNIIVDSLKLVPKGSNTTLRIRSFSINETRDNILIYTNAKRVWRQDTRGDYWIFNVKNNSLKPLGRSRPPSSLMFAKISPDGKKAAYVSEHNIYVEDIGNGAVTQMTKDGTLRIINGTFDWAYEEEFDCRDGFRWSPDSRAIAYWQIDARKIKNFLLINNTDSLYSFTIPVEYPKAGQDPSMARIGVVNLTTGKTKWMQIPGDPMQHYIPRMEWAANNTELILEQLNRKQNEAKIFLCSVETGAAKLIIRKKTMHG